MAFSQYLNFDLTYYFLICRNSYRCGIFFAGDNIGDPPRFKIFVIPKRFELDCGRSEEILKSEVKDECNELVSFHFREPSRITFAFFGICLFGYRIATVHFCSSKSTNLKKIVRRKNRV